MSVVMSADELPARARADFWRDLLNEAILPCQVRIDPDKDLRGRAVAGSVGPVQLIDLVGPGMEAVRGPRQVQRRDPELVGLMVEASGNAVFEQGGRRALLATGDMTFCESSTPYAWEGRIAGRNLLVMFPRTMLPLPPAQVDRLTARSLSGTSGCGALVLALIREMRGRLDDDGVAGNLRLATALVDLIVAAVDDGPARTVPPESRRRAGLLQIKAFILERLGERLEAAEIAAAHHLSVRTLHRLFRTEGETVNSWIRAQRLERCRRDLLDPGLRLRSAAAIGARWGFPDATHFGRAFRERYGITPAEYREAGAKRRWVGTSGR